MSTGTPPPLPPPIPAMATADSPIPSGADFGIRALARLVDAVYGMILGGVVGFSAGTLFANLSQAGKISPEWPQLIKEHPYFGIGFSMLGGYLYHAIAEGMGSVTVGKWMCGLRVLQVDGRPATIKGALIRELWYYVDALFFGIIAYLAMQTGPLRQRYGDVYGRTVVIETRVYQPREGRSEGQMFEGICLGTLLYAGMVFLGLVLKVT